MFPARRAPRLAALLILLSGFVRSAQAQPTPEPALESRPDESPAEADQAENTAELLAELRRLGTRTALSPDLLELARSLRSVVVTLDARVAEAIKRCRNVSSQGELDDLEYTWQRERGRFEPWKSRVDDSAKQLEAAERRATVIVEALASRRKSLADEQAAAVVLGALQTSQLQANSLRRELRERKSAVLRLQGHLIEAQASADLVLEAVEQHRPRLSSSFGRRASPLWKRPPDPAGVDEFPQRARDALEAAREFGASSVSRIVLHAGLGLLLALGFLIGRRNASPEALSASSLLTRPYSAALLCFALATPLFYPVPALVRAGLHVLVLFSALRHLQASEHLRLGRLAVAAPLILALDIVRRVAPTPNLETWLFLAELSTLLIAVFVGFPRPEPGIARGLRRLGSGLLLLASLALVVGYTSLSHLLGMAVLTAVFAGLVAAGATRVVADGVRTVFATPLAQRSNLIRDRGVLLEIWTRRILRGAALLLWLHLVSKALGVASDIARLALDLGSVGIKVGSVDVKVGEIATLLGSILLALVVARILRQVLRDDVLPRTPLVPGAQHAASTSAYYLVLVAGFFFALAAAGIAFSQLTFLMGALGVGIGFGLQNVVSNFVSGLILLFGRPVVVGDRIEVGGTLGIIERIGFRSATLRTYQGAELIIPNAELISTRVVNWTHSDERRRVDVDIGVAYGTDPERVIALLLQVGRQDERVIEEPAPLVLFLQHGSSSLDFQLRVWTDRFDDWVVLKSDLTRAINRTFVEQKIEIPFPQRDLHLRSLSEGAAKVLGGAGGERPGVGAPEKAQ